MQDVVEHHQTNATVAAPIYILGIGERNKSLEGKTANAQSMSKNMIRVDFATPTVRGLPSGEPPGSTTAQLPTNTDRSGYQKEYP
jgi:hypothetical protein